MKTIIKILYFGITLSLFIACGNDNNDVIDNEKPKITAEGIEASPLDCEVYQKGQTIPVRYLLKDNIGLGNYVIEIHQNFDHHTHGTSSTNCDLDADKEPINAWIFFKTYEIERQPKSYTVSQDIKIPTDIDSGDYHFMIRLTDISGWQEIKAIAIKIKD